jgi:hypothetical protein
MIQRREEEKRRKAREKDVAECEPEKRICTESGREVGIGGSRVLGGAYWQSEQ